MKLPKKLKSGRRLVATAAEGRVGLYCLGMLDEDGDYAILLPSGKVRRGMVGSKGYPLAPSGNWTWLRTKKRRAREREEKKHRTTSARLGSNGKREASTKVSSTHLCIECNRNVRSLTHAHTTVHERGYGAATICCRCIRRRGSRCSIHDRAKRAKRMAERRRQKSTVRGRRSR